MYCNNEMENKGVCIVPLLISVVSIFVMVQVLSFKPFHANVFFFYIGCCLMYSGGYRKETAAWIGLATLVFLFRFFTIFKKHRHFVSQLLYKENERAPIKYKRKLSWNHFKNDNQQTLNIKCSKRRFQLKEVTI